MRTPLIAVARIAVVLVLVSLILSSCAPQHRKDMERIEGLRVEAESLVRAQSLMGFQSWAYGAPANQDSLYRAHATLFSRENIALVTTAIAEEPDSLQKKRLRYFLRYLTTEYLSKEVAPLTDRETNYEAAATVRIEGKDIPFRQVGAMIANERNQARRAMLYRAQEPVLDSLTTLLREIEATTLRLTRELGYPSYTSMVSALKGYPVEIFAVTAENVLIETDSLYRVLLKEMEHKHLRLPPERCFAYDFGPLFRSAVFDRYFPGTAMLGTLRSTYRGMGIDIDSMKNLTIDSEPRPAKNPRAVCYAIDVPTDVRLSIKPIGGADDYNALFHEMGHALHYASTGEQSFEFKYAGEPTVTETYAFLSEYLLVNQAWLRTRNLMPMPVLKDYVRFEAFYRLFFVRRYCAKLMYELQLHAGAPHADSLYTALLDRATGVAPTPGEQKRFLVDVDALYYSASYLRAWFFESQVNAYLVKQYGANWFDHPQAGATLHSWWMLGDRLDGDEMARALGLGSISPVDWLAEIRRMVIFSSR